MLSRRVLVVGTTSDYIDLLRRRYPRRVLFVTDPAEREQAKEQDPGEEEELLCDLTAYSRVMSSLKDHTSRHGIALNGVACFDCESLELAAHLAGELGVPFPSPSAVSSCRNKFLSKRIWRAASVVCPRATLARDPSEALAFLDRLGGSVILKPLTGSGSELVFRCADRSECLEAFEMIRRRLAETKGNRMYMQGESRSGDFDPLRDVVVEEFVTGQEYSCDFTLENGNLEVIRTARKIPAGGCQVGTTAAYELPAALPAEIPFGRFREQLRLAAKAISLQRALCMVDFIVQEGMPYLLELTPRPGGDCLPWLIRQSSGLDMLGLALDFAQSSGISLPSADGWEALVGLRLIAPEAGIVKQIDSRLLDQDPRVREVLIKRARGHRVALPPKDYDSGLLGHVIFKSSGKVPVEDECAELASKLIVEMEGLH